MWYVVQTTSGKEENIKIQCETYLQLVWWKNMSFLYMKKDAGFTANGIPAEKIVSGVCIRGYKDTGRF